MADNRTNITSPESLGDLIGESWVNIIRWIMFVLNLAAAIFGVTSWCIIKKFRHFRNYVLLSAIIVKVIFIIFFHVIDSEIVTFFKMVLAMYLTVSYHCWLLVLCYIFYVDFVKVFRLDIHRRYLKSSLFAWGLPFISDLLLFAPGLYVYMFVSKTKFTYQILDVFTMSVLTMPVVISFVIYLTVLYSLFRVSEAGVSTSLNKWRRFYIASLIFVLSNVIVLPLVTSIFNVQLPGTISIIIDLGAVLNTVALAVYLIIIKSNRELWREFLAKRSKQKSLEMK